MREKIIHNIRTGFALIEILLTLAVILFLYYMVTNFYFKKTPVEKKTAEALSEQGIVTTNYKTILDTTKDKIKAVQKSRSDTF